MAREGRLLLLADIYDCQRHAQLDSGDTKDASDKIEKFEKKRHRFRLASASLGIFAVGLVANEFLIDRFEDESVADEIYAAYTVGALAAGGIMLEALRHKHGKEFQEQQTELIRYIYCVSDSLGHHPADLAEAIHTSMLIQSIDRLSVVSSELASRNGVDSDNHI